MKINHISVKSTIPNELPSKFHVGGPYCIEAELNACPLDFWQVSFKYIWNNTNIYAKLQREVSIGENVISFMLEDGNDLQNTIEAIKRSVVKTNNFVRTFKTTDIISQTQSAVSYAISK